MSKNKRLFLIAGYSAKNIVDASLVYMVQKLSKCGDVILVMDCDAPDSELGKISKYTVYATAQKHGEYDFGSYRRAYTYARDTGILSKYEFVYLINDSAYGPLYEIAPYFEKIESFNTDAFGLVYNPNKRNPHLESWFIGMRPNVFLSDWFDEFISSVTKQKYKYQITSLYEDGFTRNLDKHNHTYRCMYSAPGRSVYNRIKHFYRIGMPFMKKNALLRHNGALGNQILYVLNHIAPDTRDAILTGARQTLGDEYINWLLTKNPFIIWYRHMKYFIKKICTDKL